MKLLSLIPLVAAVLVLRTATTTAQAAALPAAAAPNVVAVPTLAGARDLGRAAGTRVDVSVVLPYRHAAELPYLLAAQRDPASAYYRHYLKPAQFRGYFAPSSAAYSAAAADLQRAGFRVQMSPNRTALHASGVSRTAERYFHTIIDDVVQVNGRRGYANVAPATIPTALSGSHLVGLNNVVVAHVAARERASGLHPSVSAGPLYGPDGGFGPLAVAKAGDFPVEHGYTGKNSNVADLIDGSVSDSDVAAFLHEFGLTRSGPRTTTISVDGGCGALCFDAFAAALDAEWILAMAPGASLFVYQVPELTNSGIVDAFNAVTSDDAVNIVNVSFGACEVSFGDVNLALAPIVAQGALEGMTFESVAFGGAGLCGTPPLVLPMAPADLDTLAAVGGSNTIVDQTGKQSAESALSSSNGGVSLIVPLPTWQAKTSGVQTAGRNVPDVVIPSEVDGTGPSIYYAGAWLGGTPFVNNAPFAGYLATVQEMYGYATPLGDIAPALYAAIDRTGYHATTSSFTDVTLGCIGSIGNVPICAKSGYDVASGIGSIAHGYTLAKSFGFGPIAAPIK